MPSLCKRRGKLRYRATVWAENTRGPTKWFPDDSKKSYRDAVAWEKVEAEKLKRKLKALTHTEYLKPREWINGYMDYIVAENFAVNTIAEKKAAFVRLISFNQLDPDGNIENIDRFMCSAFFNLQIKSGRTGNSVNKDRKNLGAAWQWGRENFRNWPTGENPFLAVSKKQEIRHPRYVPPEADYWAVYDHVDKMAQSGDDAYVQDRVMLLSYLHLAARRSELFNAKWSDIDFSTGRIRLWTNKRSGRHKEFDWLPMTTELMSTLKMWSKRRLAHDTRDKEHIFVCLDLLPCTAHMYGMPFSQRRHAMTRWCKAVGVKPFGWHAIRHLTASILYRRGEPQSKIQVILRHKSPTTTARYLRTLGINEVREALDTGLKRSNVIVLNQKKTASGGKN